MRRFSSKLATALVLAAATAGPASAHGGLKSGETKPGSHQAATVVAQQQGQHGAMAPSSQAAMLGDLELTGAWARAMLPGQPAGGGYLVIANKGDEADRLVAASSPAAGKVEIHTMAVIDNVMTMRPVEGGLEIPAGGIVELKPGGFHIMFMQVPQPFAAGGEVSVTLEFEKAGKIELVMPVKEMKPAGGSAGHGG